MPKTLIIGNALAAVAAIEEIRSRDAACEIVLLCPEGVLPYDRSLLPALIAKDIKGAAGYARPEKFSGKERAVIVNETLSRVSVKRKHITTDAKTRSPLISCYGRNAPA